MTLPGRTIVLGLAVSALAVAARAQSIDEVERTFEIAGRGDLRLSNDDGRTHVSGREGSTVVVRAVKEVVHASSDEHARELAAKVEVRVEERDGRVTVDVVRPDTERWSWSRAYVLVHLDVTAPRASDVDVATEDGPLVVEGLEGRLRLRAEDGELRVADCGGELDVSAEDGDVRLERVRGALRASLEDGDLHLEGSLDRFDAETEDGSIDARLQSGAAMASDWSLRAADGDITLALPLDFAAELDVQVRDGSISNDHSRASPSTFSDERWTARLNDGGYRIRLRTEDGSVRLDQR